MGKLNKSNFSSGVKQLLEQVTTNQQQIVTVSSVANTAKTTAENAASTANTAKSTADNASATANTAKTTADAANTSIGSLSSLTTTNKTNLVSAINEVKQLGNSVKQNMVSSLLSVDSSLPITNESSWNDIISQTGNIQTGIDINGIVQEYTVRAGQNISAGDFVEFITSTSNIGSMGTPITVSTRGEKAQAVALSETKVLVVYLGYDDDIGYAVILTINGDSITVGTPVTFESDTPLYLSITKLSETKAVVGYRAYASNNRYGTAKVLSISGTTITVGTATVFNNNRNTENVRLLALDSTKVLACYANVDSSRYGTAEVLTVSGTTITRGNPFTFDSTHSEHITMAMLTSTRVFVTYRNYVKGEGKSAILNINGTTVSLAMSPVVFASSVSRVACAKVAENKVVVAYAYGYLNAFVFNITDNTVAAGVHMRIVDKASADYLEVVPMNETKVLLNYTQMFYDSGYEAKYYAKVQMITMSGTNGVTIAPATVYDSTSVAGQFPVKLNSTKAVMLYDPYSSNYRYINARTMNLGDLTNNAQLSTDKTTIHGVALTSGSGGQTISVSTLL